MNTEVENRTLTKNSVSNFILRIDLINAEENLISFIASSMKQHFSNFEKQYVAKIDLHFNENESKITDEKRNFEYVLTSEDRLSKVTFSENDQAIVLQSSRYKNNSAYKDFLDKIIYILEDIKSSCKAKRIGLRYINEFNCDSVKKINNVFGSRLSLIVKKMIHSNDQSRVIGIEEYNRDGYKVRLQYGIPNKFYPAVVTIPNLLLDIDSFGEFTSNIQDWTTVIKQLNHAAYETFIGEMNPKYIKSIK